MIKFFRRYRLQFYILAVLLFAFNSFLNFYEYFTLEYDNATKKGMDLFGGIVMSILAIIYIANVVDYLRNKKAIGKNSL